VDYVFSTETPFDCLDNNLSDDTFVRASKSIRGRDVVEDFVACGVWLLASSVSFDQVSVSVTLMSKLKVPLPMFVAALKDGEDDTKFLARVELEAKVIVGSYTRPENDACIVGLQNNGHLNHVFELAGVAYGPHLVPDSDASTEASKKRKADATGKAPLKHPKMPGKKRAETVKTSMS
jgi:hypothetical protein